MIPVINRKGSVIYQSLRLPAYCLALLMASASATILLAQDKMPSLGVNAPLLFTNDSRLKEVSINRTLTLCTPTIAISTFNDYACTGISNTFKAIISNGGTAPSFQWMKNGASVGTNADTYTTNGLVPGDVISCMLTSNAACASPATANSNSIVIQVPGVISTVAGSATFVTGDGGPAVDAGFLIPYDVCFDDAGNMYVADIMDSRIRKVDAVTGVITTIAGNGNGGFSGDGGPAANAQLFSPAGICYAAGNLYIADGSNYRIRKIDLSTGIITTIAGTGVQGAGADGVPAIASELRFPISVCVDAANNLYFSDRDNNRIRVVNLNTGIIRTIAGTAGVAAYDGDGGLAVNALLNNPDGIALNRAGDLYICDQTNSRVRKISAKTGIITTVAGNGVKTFAGDNVLATQASLYLPSKICIDDSGNLYISDLNNSRIRKVDTASGIITTIAGIGNWTVLGDGGPAIKAGIEHPTGITIYHGYVYFADRDLRRVRKFSVPYSSATMPTVISTNGTDFCADTVVHLKIVSGKLNDAVEWRWYQGSCDGIYLGSGDSLNVPINNSTTYYVRGEGPCVVPGVCNSIIISVSNSVQPKIVIAANPSNEVCEGSTVSFSATLTNGGNTPILKWEKNGVDIGVNTASYAASTLANGDIISCELTSNAHCALTKKTVSNTIAMKVTPTPKGNISPDAATLCFGQSVTLTASSASSYQWSMNGTPLPGAINASYQAVQEGSYSVLLFNQNCSALASNNAVITKGIEEKAMTYPTARVAANTPYPLQARAIGQNYSWTPAIGLSNASISNPTLVTNQDRQYRVTISSPTLCPVTDIVNVEVFTKAGVYVPSAFTPNGDGLNDLLKPLTVQVKDGGRFMVLNRWGNLVFESNRNEGWNGFFQGKEQPAGVYVWFFEGIDTQGNKVQEKGTVLLIR